MKLRIARKIIFGNNDLARYREDQLARALKRFHKTQSSKDDQAYWNYLVANYREKIFNVNTTSA